MKVEVKGNIARVVTRKLNRYRKEGFDEPNIEGLVEKLLLAWLNEDIEV